jgi:hypothetical protein
MDMIPTRKDTPGARVAKIQNIDAIVRAKLGQPSRGAGESFQSPVLGRSVTMDEIENTARNRNTTPEAIKQQLGIQ